MGYGYRKVTALLRMEGWRVNHKRIERLWRSAQWTKLLFDLSFSRPRQVLMIVVYDNWMTVGSAILDMRVIPWEVVM